jgi:hypothetical protein
MCYDSRTDKAVEGIEQLYEFIVNAITVATTRSIPRIKHNYFKHWWDTELSDAKTSSIQAYKDWVFFGKPKSGYPHSNMLKKKMEYKRLLKNKQKQSNIMFSNELANNLLDRSKEAFWKSWKSKFQTSAPARVINGYVDSAHIANEFGVFFNSACNSHSKDRHEELKRTFDREM